MRTEQIAPIVSANACERERKRGALGTVFEPGEAASAGPIGDISLRDQLGTPIEHNIGSLIAVVGWSASALSGRTIIRPQSVTTDDWVLICQKSFAVSKDGSPAAASIQFCPVLSFADVYEPASWAISIFFPRSTFKGLEDKIEAIAAGDAEFEATPLLAAYLDSLWHYVSVVEKRDESVVEAVTIQLVRASLLRVGNNGGGFARSANNSRLETARQFIDERLSSPYLSVESIQKLLGISRRQVYLLFEPYGGVVRYILNRRLKKAYALFVDETANNSVSRVAELCGIDPHRLDRLFREEFGIGPNELANDPSLPSNAHGTPIIDCLGRQT